ncbi:hypothetical protein F5Y04DRAFT_32239 [Hypomontagnella monticulosa]|nr:hypothetical protein F5Y04DRAFT_32239 [Hypomontagnella monticulosa]
MSPIKEAQAMKFRLQGGDVDELEHVIDAQGDIIVWQKRAIDELKATVAFLEDTSIRRDQQIEHQQARNKVLENALRVMGDVRDVQEDKLDEQAEAIDKLSAELRSARTQIDEANRTEKALQARLRRKTKSKSRVRAFVRDLQGEVAQIQRVQATPEPAKEPDRESDISDEELYQFLVSHDNHKLAAELRESALNLERLRAVDREWMYKTSEPKEQSSKEDDCMKKFMERAGANGIRIALVSV